MHRKRSFKLKDRTITCDYELPLQMGQRTDNAETKNELLEVLERRMNNKVLKLRKNSAGSARKFQNEGIYGE